MLRRFAVAPVIVLWAAGASCLQACDVPVFRYALERWQPESYELVVFHRGPLVTADSGIIRALESPPGKALPAANCTVRTVDLATLTEGRLEALWESLGARELPYLVITYPRGPGVDQVIWSGPLTAGTAGRAIDSPARREIGRRITDGQSAVWVLVESGDRAKDNAAAALLEKQLELLKNTLKLPPAVDRPAPGNAPDLRADFSFIRVSRTDEAEKMLVRMLMRTESDLDSYTSWPMAFPVFGRGRVLFALVGEGITEENIREACEFVVGPCACEIKDMYPGLDLLTSTDWESSLGGSWVAEVGLGPLVGLAGLEQAPSSAEDLPKGNLFRNILLFLVAAGAVIAVVSYGVIKSAGRRKK